VKFSSFAGASADMAPARAVVSAAEKRGQVTYRRTAFIPATKLHRNPLQRRIRDFGILPGIPEPRRLGSFGNENGKI